MKPDERDFWDNAKCFGCGHWSEVHRYCHWAEGGFYISWVKCQGRGFCKPEDMAELNIYLRETGQKKLR